MGAVTKQVRIDVPADQAYRLWRDPEGFSEFMPDVEAVENRGDRWHWKVAGPLGRSVEWDSEVTEDEPGRRIAWRSMDGQVENSGAVSFADVGGDATDLEYEIEFTPPGGPAGEAVAKMFADPEEKVERSRAAFKELCERDARPRTDHRAHVDADEASPGAPSEASEASEPEAAPPSPS